MNLQRHLPKLVKGVAVLAVVLGTGCDYGYGYRRDYGYPGGYGGRGGYGSNPTAVPRGSVPPSGVADVTITITGVNGSMSFSPNPATAKVGQKVAWHNADAITHTATANAGVFDTGGIGPGGTSAAIAMVTAGSFNYHCGIHPSMVAMLSVVP